MATTTQTQTTNPQVITLLKDNGINYTLCNITVRNRNKKVQNYKAEADYPKKLSHSWTIYNKDECKLHNKYVKKNKKVINSVNALPSQSGFVVVDFDSKEEYEKAVKGYFPTDGFHTISVRNELPHYYVKIVDSDKPMKKWMGKAHNYVDGQKVEREIDLITDNIFENLQTEVKGDFLPHMTVKDLCEVLSIDYDSIQYEDTYEERREKALKPKKKKIVVKKAQKKPTNISYTADTQWPNSGELKDQQNKNKGMELIEFVVLTQLINGLDPLEIKSHDNWFKMVVATANIVKRGTDPYKYLNMLNDYCKKHEDVMCLIGFDPKYNEQCFTKAFLEADSRPPKDKCGANTLWNFLHKQNIQLWKELAFNKHRPINPYDFAELNLQEALKAFNNNHAIIKGEAKLEIVSWDEGIKSYKNMSSATLKDNYQNLKYKKTIYFSDKELTQIEKEKDFLQHQGVEMDDDVEDMSAKVKRAHKNVKQFQEAQEDDKGIVKGFVLEPFIDEWFDWLGRNQYERDGFYPKTTPPLHTFNLFQGFQIEKIEDYDHIVNEMNKEELEHHLAFMFQHIKYIMGNDLTDELSEFFLKYMAHLIKYPAVIPRVGWFIHGMEGSGKGQLLNFFENIVGSEYVVATTNGKNLFGDFNAMINHKLIVNFNEIDNLNKYIEMIKSLTTDKDLWTTKKGKETKRYDNYARVLFFGNNSNKMIVGFSDRRWIVCETEIRQRFEKGYNEKLAQQVNSIFVQKCMTRYLKEFVQVDKHFNFEKARPLTQSYHNVRSRHTPYFHKFLKFMFETGNFWVKNNINIKDPKSFTKTELYNCFMSFIEYTNEKRLDISMGVFENDLGKFVLPTGELSPAFLEGYVDKIFHKHKTDRWKYSVNKARLMNFITKHSYDWDDGSSLFNESTDDEEE